MQELGAGKRWLRSFRGLIFFWLPLCLLGTFLYLELLRKFSELAPLAPAIAERPVKLSSLVMCPTATSLSNTHRAACWPSCHRPSSPPIRRTSQPFSPRRWRSSSWQPLCSRRVLLASSLAGGGHYRR